MPLSDREQRILQEIERNLEQEDPGFARGVSKAKSGGPRTGRVKLGGALFVVGLVLLVAFFATRQLIIGVAAFGAMVAGIVLFVGSANGLVGSGRAGGRAAGTRMKSFVSDFQERLKKRYGNR